MYVEITKEVAALGYGSDVYSTIIPRGLDLFKAIFLLSTIVNLLGGGFKYFFFTPIWGRFPF